MRISDWSSDVCSSDLCSYASDTAQKIGYTYDDLDRVTHKNLPGSELDIDYAYDNLGRLTAANQTSGANDLTFRSEEHTSELQSLMRISYAVFCLKKKKQYKQK